MKGQHNFRQLISGTDISDVYVNSIIKDHCGFMWFSTLDGLNRFDGYRYRKYSVYSSGGRYNGFSELFEDYEGTIWAINTEQVYVYDRATDILISGFDKLSSLGLPSRPQKFLIDNDRNIVCNNNDTIFKYSFDENRLQTIILKDESIQRLCSSNLYSIALTESGKIIKISWNDGQYSLSNYANLPSSADIHCYIDTRNRLWCHDFYSNFIYCINLITNTEIDTRSIVSSTGGDFIKSIIDDTKGNLWFGTNSKGIFIFNNELQLCEELKYDNYKNYTIPSNHINCLYKDNEDILWVGTAKQGVVFTPLDEFEKELLYTAEPEEISCFSEDNEGNLLIGYDGSGLVRYNKNGLLDRSFKTSNSNIPSDIILSTKKDSKGGLIFSTYGDGLFHFDNSKFSSLNVSEKIAKRLKFCREFQRDLDNNLWIGTFRHGVFCLSPDGQCREFNQKNSNLPTNSITAIAFSPIHNKVYVGTGVGTISINPQTEDIQKLDLPVFFDSEQSTQFVTCLYCDERGLLWIGTRSGLIIYDEKNNESTTITVNNGLSNNYIKAITSDNNGNIWTSTSRGYTHIIVEGNSSIGQISFVCHPYFEDNGSGAIQFNPHAIYTTKEGDILMGTNSSFLRIRPRGKYANHKLHKVTFTDLFINNSRVAAGSTINGRVILPKNIQLTDHIQLNHDEDNFAIEMSSLDFNKEGHAKYSYRLNEKSQWIDQEDNRIYFNKLASGKYELQVKVQGDAETDDTISTLIIEVKPPLLLSYTAKFVYLIIVIAILIASFRYYQIRTKKRFAEQRDRLRAQQLHEMDEMKLQFFTNISHDLRTPLSLVITPINRLIKSVKDTSLLEELELVRRNASIMMDEVEQLLDFNKLDKIATRYNPSIGNLAFFVKDLCNSFRLVSPRQDITLNIRIEKDDIETAFDRNKMQRILYNLLSNAYKYNVEGGEVLVSITQEDNNALLTISDTGIGIKDKRRIFERFYQEKHASDVYTGNGIGLHIVKEYVALHNGKIDVYDNNPQGSIFRISLPIVSIDNLLAEQTLVVEDSSVKDNNKKSILIVDDNEDFRHFIASCLKEQYNVFTAADGQKALAVMEKHDMNLIISDVMMPVMDGLELCQRIKNDLQFSHIPVILLTARTAKDHIVEGYQTGADDYITKPFDIEILQLKIEKILLRCEENYNKCDTMEVSPQEVTFSQIDSKLLGKIMSAIDRHMTDSEYSVEQLSSDVGISRSGLYKKLISITGKSPIEFIRILRLKKGKQLLDEGETSMSQIAYQIGIAPKLFSKYFKEIFGCLPSEYKKK